MGWLTCGTDKEWIDHKVTGNFLINCIVRGKTNHNKRKKNPNKQNQIIVFLKNGWVFKHTSAISRHLQHPIEIKTWRLIDKKTPPKRQNQDPRTISKGTLHTEKNQGLIKEFFFITPSWYGRIAFMLSLIFQIAFCFV